MRFERAALEGAWVIQLDPIEDERGSFVRTFCAEEFADHGIGLQVAQANTSFNRRAGTLRGMHYQADPHGECKLIRCTRGALYDVLVDLRSQSASYRRWLAVELTAANGRMVFAPANVAHGFKTLLDDTEVSYLMSHPYVPEAQRGVRWDDPAFGIEWPPGESFISERDLGFEDFSG
jgi:dTDP-4-dehydrorhamnose 3,5-epimerase